MTSTDRLLALYDVLTAAGDELDLVTFLRDTAAPCTDAWVGDDLTSLAASALSVLVAEVDAWGMAHEHLRRRRAPRLLVACRLALVTLPLPLEHLHGPYVVGRPAAEVDGLRVLRCADELRELVAEHDRGAWVEAVRAAGTVADLLDLVVVFMAESDLVALDGTHDVASLLF